LAIPNLSSCSKDETPQVVSEEENDNDEINVTLTISTRGSDSIEDANGTFGENYVDPSNLRIYFSNSGNYGGVVQSQFTPEEVLQIDDNTYQVSGKMPSLPSGTFRIAVFANWPSVAEFTFGTNYILEMGIRKGCEYSYPYGNGSTDYYEPSATNPMPMYGIKTYSSSSAYSLTTYSNGTKEYDFGTVYLIRSMAKIIVKSTAGSQIDSVTLSHCYNLGNSAPIYVYVDSETTPITNTQMSIPGQQTSVNRFNPYTSNLTKDIPFKSLGDNTYVLYVPEYQNTSNSYGAVPTFFTLTSDGKEFQVDFVDYDQTGSTDAFNLLRNHMYIYDIEVTKYATLKYVVQKWDTYTSPTITFD
jgi:hypothetical protein